MTERLVRSVVAAVTRSRDGFPDRIHPADEMYLYNLDLLHGNPTCAAILYFVKGRQAATTILEIARWWFHDRELGPVLDFAGGYGRVTRFLVRDLPLEKLWVADAVGDAVRFQQNTFGVHGFVAPPAPEDLALGRTFPLVVACSLFSHLPRTSFGPWLRRLGDLVGDGGLLAVSALDMSLLGDAGADDGFAFFPESESRVLEGDRYGTTYVTERFFRAVLREEGLGGWVRDVDPDGGITELRVHVNDRVLSTFAPSSGDANRDRWTTRIRRDAVALDDVVVVEAVNGRGAANVLAIGTLRPYVTGREETGPEPTALPPERTLPARRTASR